MASFFGKLVSSNAASPVVTAPSGAPVRVATRKTGRFAVGTGAAALLCTTIGGFEGLKLNAYPDPATRGQPWTVCYGHTGADVTPGVRKSLEECKALLIKDTAFAWSKVQGCTRGTDAWSDSRAVAILSLTYNIGAGGYCKSSVAKRFNAGDAAGACDALLSYHYAAGMSMPGLVRRRQQERRLCLEQG